MNFKTIWLSKGNFLDRFCNLFDSVVQFLTEKDPELGSKIVQSHCDIMYLADFFEKMNDVCTKLQGKEISLIQCKCTIAGFAGRLDVYKQNKKICVYYITVALF